MSEQRDFRRMLEEGWRETSDTFGETSRLAYLGDFIFDFTTYDSGMSELFARQALGVCAAISDKKTFEYIADTERYLWFLMLCNTPFFASKIEWGTSIRGAWWDNRIEFSSCGLWLDGKQLTDTMVFTADEWRGFVAALQDFASEELE